MPEPLDLKFLYHFSCTSNDILEIKVNGLKEGTPIGKIYHWLYYDRTTQTFLKLGFKSMDTQEGRQHRAFEQGELWFDASQANLKLETNTTSQEFTLEVNKVDSIPDELISQVQHFLQQELIGRYQSI
jgi:hypothetical protein